MSGLHVFLTADGGSVAASSDDQVVAEGRLRRARRGWDLTAGPLGPGPLDPEALGGVLARLHDLAGRGGGGPARWLVSDPTKAHDAAADHAGLTERRDLLQLRCPLPVAAELRGSVPAPSARPFRPGTDEEAWLTVNNRAFADHPDQSGQTLADVVALEHEAWFDPAGFLLVDADPAGERAGQLDAFCWTKVHQAAGLGEIFVIGVDPSARGRGLGPALTLAGLDHLAGRGLTVGMLYVDVANAGAVRMYTRLGFATHHLDRIYSG